MYPGSSQSESDLASQDDKFTVPKSKKRGRKPKSTPESSNPTTPTQDMKRPALDKTTSRTTSSTSITLSTPTPTTSMSNTNQSRHLMFKLSFSVIAPPTLTRIQLAIKWEHINKTNKDVIIKYETNFLIKTNDEFNTTNALELLKEQGVIMSFKMQTHSSNPPMTTNVNRGVRPSFSVVATGVDLDITDEMFLNHLKEIHP